MATAAAQREDLATIGSTLKVMIRLGRPHQNIERTHLPEQELIHAATFLRRSSCRTSRYTWGAS